MAMVLQEKLVTAVVSQEADWFVAQALEVDVASQGESPNVALENLAEALEIHFETPRPTESPRVLWRVSILRGISPTQEHLG